MRDNRLNAMVLLAATVLFAPMSRTSEGNPQTAVGNRGTRVVMLGTGTPKLLILYHQLFWGTTEEELLEELRQHYHGRVVSGRDLDIF